MLGVLGATDRLREVLGAGLLGVWIRGVGLGADLGVWTRGVGLGADLVAGACVDRALACGPDALPRPLNIPRSEFGWAAVLCASDILRVSSEATPADAMDLIFPYLRHMARPPDGLG